MFKFITMIKSLVRIVGFLAVFISLIQPLKAQNTPLPNVGNSRINQFSDQQIVQLWQQAMGAGMSESDAMKALVRKGLKPAEVTQFKRSLVAMQANKKSLFTNNNLVKDTTGFLRDSTWLLDVPQLKKPSNRYGYDFFSNPNISFEPNLRVATPKNYVLGSDDQLVITLTGLSATTPLGYNNLTGVFSISQANTTTN